MLSAGRDMAAPSAALRQRRAAPGGGGGGGPEAPGRAAAGAAGGGAVPPVSPGTFWLTRIVLLRAVALLYRECPGAVLLAVAPGREEKQKKGELDPRWGLQGSHTEPSAPRGVCVAAGRRGAGVVAPAQPKAASVWGGGVWGAWGGRKGVWGEPPALKSRDRARGGARREPAPSFGSECPLSRGVVS